MNGLHGRPSLAQAAGGRLETGHRSARPWTHSSQLDAGAAVFAAAAGVAVTAAACPHSMLGRAVLPFVAQLCCAWKSGPRQLSAKEKVGLEPTLGRCCTYQASSRLVT